MKSQFLILKGILSVSLIVLTVAIAVNYRENGGARRGNARVADGVPLPPPIQPPPGFGAALVADGVPLPPPIQPPPRFTVVLVADGVPLPPPIQPPPRRYAV